MARVYRSIMRWEQLPKEMPNATAKVSTLQKLGFNPDH